ncbi:MAG: hypothetical protein ACK55Z_12730 [bacterium]
MSLLPSWPRKQPPLSSLSLSRSFVVRFLAMTSLFLRLDRTLPLLFAVKSLPRFPLRFSVLPLDALCLVDSAQDLDLAVR